MSSVNLLKEILTNEKKFMEIAKMAFNQVDINKSGQIEAGEFYKIFKELSEEQGSESPTKEDILELLRYLDDDGSGKISFEEFKQLIRDLLNFMIKDESIDSYNK